MKKTLEVSIRLKIDLENLTVTGEVEQVKNNPEIKVELSNDVMKTPDDSSIVKDFACKEGWETVKEYVKHKMDMPNLTYNVWIEPLEVEKVQYNTIYLKNHMEGSEMYIKEKYFLPIRSAIMELFQKDYHIAFANE